MSNVLKYINVSEKEKKIIQHEYKVPRIASESTEMVDDYPNEQVDSILKEAEANAKELVHKAEMQAAELVDQEKAKIKKWWNEKRDEDTTIQKEARELGYEEGFQKGRTEAEEQVRIEYSELLENAKQLLEEAYQMKDQIIQDSENVILELSTAIAKKIIHKELDMDPGIVKEMIKAVIKTVNESERISLFVHPDYFSYIQVAKEELIAELNGQVELLIFPDPSVSSGGCMIKTSYETIDAKVDTQLEEIKTALLDATGRRDE